MLPRPAGACDAAPVTLGTWILLAAVLGQPVPDWPTKPAGSWVQGGPLTLSGLRGKVVLVRFFTDTGCPYCSETAPALRELDKEFAPKGLVVIGVFTPKPKPRPVDVAEARAASRAYGFEFPVVVDDDWGALRAWAWGASRGLDWLETESSVDSKRVGIEGVSRYGKAALVAMAFDERFAVVLVGSSGEGGAKLHRRNFGEAVENLTAAGEYHWMAGNFVKYGAADATFGSMTPGDLPVDAHELHAADREVGQIADVRAHRLPRDRR